MSMFAGAGGLLTGFVGAVIEAWAQLRIGKLRVLLSLVGVAAAVAAMSFVIAVGQVSVSAINSEIEQGVGRPGTVTINVSPTGKDVTASAVRTTPGTMTPGPRALRRRARASPARVRAPGSRAPGRAPPARDGAARGRREPRRRPPPRTG